MRFTLIVTLLSLLLNPLLGQEAILDFTAAKQFIKGNTFVDKTGRAQIAPKSNIKIKKNKFTEVAVFDGVYKSAVISTDMSSQLLPQKNFTVEAWVSVHGRLGWGSIIGAFQDNGEYERGWVLGYSNQTFYFGLTSTQKKRMTYLRSSEERPLGSWNHVLASYDGHTMKLYINGNLVGESTEQKGAILYPEKGFYELGSYHDENENAPFLGEIKQVAVYNGVVKSQKVKQLARKWQGLYTITAPGNAKEMIVKPYLQFATQTSIKVLWETSVKSTSVVEYGETAALGKSVKVSGMHHMHEVKISGLKPNTPYYYRVRSRTMKDEFVSLTSTFQTAVNKSDAYAFAVFSDTQTNPEIWGKIAGLGWKQRPHFAIHCGDIVGEGDRDEQWLNDFLAPGNKFMRRFPIYLIPGNHDKDHANYYKYVANPEPEYRYTFHYGNAQFFMLDSDRSLAKGSPQYKWLEAELKTSTAKWKFVAHHHPIYTSDENDYGDSYQQPTLDGDPDLVDVRMLYEKYNVDIGFYGHIHDYERTWPTRNGKVDETGVRYILAGGSGGGLEDYAPTKKWFSAKIHTDHHFVYIMVHGNKLQLQAIDQNGILFDTLTIEKE